MRFLAAAALLAAMAALVEGGRRGHSGLLLHSGGGAAAEVPMLVPSDVFGRGHRRQTREAPSPVKARPESPQEAPAKDVLQAACDECAEETKEVCGPEASGHLRETKACKHVSDRCQRWESVCQLMLDDTSYW